MNKLDANLKRIEEIRSQMEEMVSTAKKEKRALTAEEETTWSNLRAERSVLNMEVEIMRSGKFMQDAKISQLLETARRSRELEQTLRNVRKEKRTYEFELRSLMDMATTGEPGGMVPLTIGDVWDPVEKGLILDKIGIKLQTGLVGDYVWPIITSGVECTVEDENAEVADSTIPMSKLKPEPKRIAIAIPVSNTLIDNTAGVVWQVVMQQVPMALVRTLNKCAFGGAGLELKGLMDSETNIPTVTITASAPTWSEVMGLPSKVASEGFNLETACFVMNSAMKYRLKTQPKDAGSGLFVCDSSDMIDGIPVFTTEYFPADKMLFGNFSYFLQGQFGQTRVTIDPLTGAKKNLTYVILNTNYSQSVVDAKAFAIGQGA